MIQKRKLLTYIHTYVSIPSIIIGKVEYQWNFATCDIIMYITTIFFTNCLTLSSQSVSLIKFVFIVSGKPVLSTPLMKRVSPAVSLFIIFSKKLIMRVGFFSSACPQGLRNNNENWRNSPLIKKMSEWDCINQRINTLNWFKITNYFFFLKIDFYERILRLFAICVLTT